MTWEWAALLSVLTVCGTLLTIICLFLRRDSAEFTSSIDGIVDRLSQLETRQPEIDQLVETAKKIVSEANLAKGLRQQR